jgi:molecular chaperone GrpE
MTDQEGQTEQTKEQEREAPIEQIRQLKMRIETLEKELADEREKATDYMNRAMRAQADVSNVRKRLQQDLALAMKEALKSVIYEQLAVLDSFDRAFSSLPNEFRHFSWVEGVGLIQTQLFSILHRTGVTPIEVIKGKQYNPIEHEVVAYEETGDYPEEAVTAELQRGYRLQEQVLRPALVKIARTPQAAATGATGGADNATENITTTTE